MAYDPDQHPYEDADELDDEDMEELRHGKEGRRP